MQVQWTNSNTMETWTFPAEQNDAKTNFCIIFRFLIDVMLVGCTGYEARSRVTSHRRTFSSAGPRYPNQTSAGGYSWHPLEVARMSRPVYTLAFQRQISQALPC